MAHPGYSTPAWSASPPKAPSSTLRTVVIAAVTSLVMVVVLASAVMLYAGHRSASAERTSRRFECVEANISSPTTRPCQ